MHAQTTCFVTRYPRVIGGTTGDTAFYSVDQDADGNLVLGGQTSDTGLASIYAATDPIVVNVQRGNFYRWGVSVAGVDYDRIQSVKYNPAGDKVFAALDVSLTKPIAIIILNSLDGSLIKYHYSGTQNMGPLRSHSLMLIDATDQVIAANNLYGPSTGWSAAVQYRSSIFKANPLGATPLTLPFYLEMNSGSQFSQQGILALLQSPSLAKFYAVGGPFTNFNSFTGYSTFDTAIFQIDSASGKVDWEFGYQESFAFSATAYIMRLAALDIASQSMWICGDKLLSTGLKDMIFINLQLPTDGTVPLDSSTIKGVLSSQSLKCHQIKAQTTTQSFIIVSDGSSNFQMMRTTVCGTAICYESYNFGGAFSGSTLNRLQGFIFIPSSTNAFMVGSVASLGGNLGQLFSKNVGFVMKFDYMSTVSQTECLQLTISYQPSVTMAAFSKAFSSLTSKFIKTSPKSVNAPALIPTTSTLLNMNLISQNSWCPSSTILSLSTLSLPDQSYTVGDLSSSSAYSFTDFTYSFSPACSDTTSYTYKIKLLDGTDLPTFIVFNKATNTFSWAAATISGVYDIVVTGYVGNAQSVSSQFRLTVSDCASAAITFSVPTGVTISTTSKYPVQATPTSLQLPLKVASSNKSVAQCGALTYSVTYSLAGTQTGVYTLTTANISPYGTMNVIIVSTSDLTLIGQTDTLTVIVTQHPQASNTYTFSVQFTGGCNTAKIIAPSTSNPLSYNVNDPMMTYAITNFQTDIAGCSSIIQYECVECVLYSGGINFNSGTSPPQLQVQISDNSLVSISPIFLTIQASTDGLNFNSQQIITVTFIPDCSLVTSIESVPISPIQYALDSGEIMIVEGTKWTTGFSQCDGQIQYSLKDSKTNLAPDVSVFTYLGGTQVQIFTTDQSKAMTYTLNLSGLLGSSVSQSMTFTVSIISLCDSASPVSEPLSPQNYVIGDPSLSIVMTPWKDSLEGNTCGAIQYTATDNDKALDKAWIQFDSVKLKFNVKTSDRSKIGKHQIKLQGKLTRSGKTAISLIFIELLDPCETSSVQASIIQDQQYQAAASTSQPEFQIKFAGFKDSSGGKCEPITYTVMSIPSQNLTTSYNLKVNGNDKVIIFKPDGLIDVPSALSVNLVGQNVHGKTSSSPFSIIINPDPKLQSVFSALFGGQVVPKNKTIKNNLYVRLKSVDSKGIAKFVFSKPLMQITNLSVLIEYNVIQFSVMSSQPINVRPKIFSWKIIGSSETTLDIKLQFDKPELISQNGESDYLKATFAVQGFFRSADFVSQIKLNTGVQAKFPPQQGNSTFAQNIESLAQQSKKVISGTFGINFIITLIFGGSMSNMWQLMSIIQIITILPLMDVSFSPIFLTMGNILINLAQFNIMPDWLSLKGVRAAIVGVSNFNQLITFSPPQHTNSTTSSKRLLQESANQIQDIPDIESIDIF